MLRHLWTDSLCFTQISWRLPKSRFGIYTLRKVVKSLLWGRGSKLTVVFKWRVFCRGFRVVTVKLSSCVCVDVTQLFSLCNNPAYETHCYRSLLVKTLFNSILFKLNHRKPVMSVDQTNIVVPKLQFWDIDVGVLFVWLMSHLFQCLYF